MSLVTIFLIQVLEEDCILSVTSCFGMISTGKEQRPWQDKKSIGWLWEKPMKQEYLMEQTLIWEKLIIRLNENKTNTWWLKL